MTPRARRAAIAAGIVIGGAWSVVSALDLAAPGPRGPASSSYATAREGFAAWAELLERAGHPVRRLRGAIESRALGRGSTVVVLDPDAVPHAETLALERFVRGGGVLIGGGAGPNGWLARIAGGGVRWSALGDERPRALRAGLRSQGVRRLRTAGEGAFTDTGPLRPVIAGAAGALAATGRVGQGRVVALADASALQNRLLAHADNAAFALALASPTRRPVLFAEGAHGYGRSTGLGAVPSRWWTALGGVALAALAFMASRVRRLGPPEAAGRPLAPPRRAYVDALAATLARSDARAQAGAPVRAAARRAVERRGGLGPHASDEAVRAAARRLGLAEREIEAVIGSRVDDLAAGAALARLTGGAGA